MAKNSSRTAVAVFLIGLGCVTLAGLGIYVSNTNSTLKNAASAKDDSQSTKIDPVDVQVVPDSERQAITVYEAYLDGNNTKYRSTVVTPPAGVDPKVFAINQALENLTFVPLSARAKSVSVKGGVATVDFPESIMAGYASMEEGVLVNSVAATLSGFSGVEGFQFTIDGQAIETLGHLDLSSAQKVQKPE